MKKTQILKSILIPTLGISAIGTIAAVSTSCGEIHVDSVILNENTKSIGLGDTYELIATVFPENATNKTVTWTSSNVNAVTVQNGIIFAKGLGEATIIVTTNDGGKTATCTVMVEPIHVESIKIAPINATLDVGDTKTLTATVLPENATNKSVTWSSSNTSVATVDQNGKILAFANGTVTITATSVDNPNITSAYTFFVTSPNFPYVAITSNGDSSFAIYNNGGNNPNLQYSTDGGTTWAAYSRPMSISQGQSLYLKGNNPTGWSSSDSVYSYFAISGETSVSGNVMALLDNGAQTGESGDITDIPCDNCFYDLFRDVDGLTSVSEDFLPATTLTGRCYDGMFYNCTSLIYAPKLPATTLTSYCYNYMFYGCSSLINPPALPAQTLGYRCYFYMFRECKSLLVAPELPATTLAYGCYYGMFQNCSSLKASPKLPATTLADYCYCWMFNFCISLTTAPELPATNLANSCYRDMFKDCWSLTTAPKLPATTLADNCYSWMFFNAGVTTIKLSYAGDYNSTYFNQWAYGLPASGTFYYSGITQTAQDFKLPSGWTTTRCQDKYVAITANAESTLTLKNNGGNNPDLQYSTDGINWTTYGSTINVNQGQTLYLKGNNHAWWSTTYTNYSYLSITGDVSISGNVMGLLDNGKTSGEAGDITDIPCDYCFYDLFRDSTGITSVDEDFLPATTLTEHCYDGMFYQCTSLTNAPKLSSMSLAVSCYQHMFNGCTSLTTAPELPAATLKEYCYRTMFKNCSSLTTAPNLPATSLADYCYDWMFQNCSSLTTAPELLPATTLAEHCYYGMFNGCASLTTAPKLPATILDDGCYGRIFDGCSSLNSIKIGYTGDYSDTYFNNWVTGVASSGIFYYNGEDTVTNYGFPSSWTKQPF